MTFDKEEFFMEDQSVLRWVRITAGIAGLVGAAALIALIAENSFAADPSPAPRGGFTPGARTFTNPNVNPANPFGNNPPPPPPGGSTRPYFDPDAEEEEDFGGEESSVNFPPPGGGGPTYSAGGQPSTPGNEPVRTEKGISVGGGTPGGTISRGKTPPALPVDSETAEGSKEQVTDFNFPDADIMDIAKTLGKLTGKNFILDKDVKGRITIISNSPITVGDAWKAFLTALDMNGFALIPSGKYIRIARQRDARDKQLKTYTGEFSPDTDALITRVFPLKYISAEEVARTFRSFMPANSRIIPYEQTNTVIVTDTGSNIAKLSKMLEILDIEGYDAGIEVIPVKFASASELSKLVDQLVPGTGTTGPGGAAGPRFGGAGGRFSARRTKEGGIINTIIADERTNTLIVHANTKGADQVRELVAKLDQKQPARQGGGKVHVIYLQFAEAEAIANTLNNISTTTAGRPAATPAGGTGVNPLGASLFEGSIKVSPDKSTNSLVVTASPGDFVTVQRVVNRLDIPRDQVYVEVVVMEVQLTDGSEWSSNVALPTSGISLSPNQDLLKFIQNPLSATGAVIGFSAGAKQTITVGGTSYSVYDLQGLIKLIQTNTRSNILATPQIIALDNAEANFESAEKIPVPTTTNVQGIGSQYSFTKESVALSIKIKPQINKTSNFVKLETLIKMGDISNRVPKAAADYVFATLDRTAQTTVVVGDSDTVVIGGLIRDKVEESINKIPILGDIPLLGWLFKSRITSNTKSNLLVFMTPHIVRPYEKIRAILDKKLRERDEFLEANTGGVDPLRGTRDNIIRSLPDLKEFSKKPETTVSIDDESMPLSTPASPTQPPQIAVPPPGMILPPPGGEPGGIVGPEGSPPPPTGMDSAAPPPGAGG